MQTLELGRAELWFCAPNTPAKDEAHVWALKDGRTIRARILPSRLPSLQQGRPRYEVFVQEESERGPSAILRSERTNLFIDSEDMDELQWRRAMGGKYMTGTMRLWRPEADNRFVIASRSFGDAHVMGLCDDPLRLTSTSFAWSEDLLPEQFNYWPQDEFNAFFVRQFADETSALRLAYEWNGWDENERTAHATRCAHGTWTEFKSLADCVMTLSWECDDFEPPWYDDPWNVLERDSFDDDDPFRANAQVLEEWANILRRVFRPLVLRDDAPDFERHQLHVASQNVLPLHRHDEPSAHEKMEAMLRLREWVQIHAPDEGTRLLDFSR